MTEQESEIKRVISYIRSCREAGIDTTITIDKNRNRFILNALEEIQQYRALGTVEELKSKIDELERWHTDHIVDGIKNEFANTSTLICHNCDHKDEYIMELEAEVKEAKGKHRAKKPFIQRTDEKTLYKCLCCKNVFVEAYENSQRGYIPKYCEMCGQSIDF